MNGESQRKADRGSAKGRESFRRLVLIREATLYAGATGLEVESVAATRPSACHSSRVGFEVLDDALYLHGLNEFTIPSIVSVQR